MTIAPPKKPRTPSRLTVTGMVALLLVVLAAVSFLFGIWTKDDRWIQTGSLFVIPGSVLSTIWGICRS
jgi:hypothetical protein